MSIALNVSTSAFNPFKFPQLLQKKTRALRTKYRWACGPDVHPTSRQLVIVQRGAPLGWMPHGEKWALSHWFLSLFLPSCPGNVFLLLWPYVILDRVPCGLGPKDKHKAEAGGISGSNSREKDLCLLLLTSLCVDPRSPHPPTHTHFGLSSCRKTLSYIAAPFLYWVVDHLWLKEKKNHIMRIDTFPS